MKQGRKPKEGFVRLYDHLAKMSEKGKWSTGWHSAEDICDFLFGATTLKNLEKTKSVITSVRRALRQQHQKFFYFTETDGYVLLSTENHHREVIKKFAAISDGFRITANEVYSIGKLSIPELRSLEKDVDLIDDGTRIQ